MAFDSEHWNEQPRFPTCPKCHKEILPGDQVTNMYFYSDPDGSKGMSGAWHAECAKPFWETKLLKAMDAFKDFGF
jgi:hypothetical protein